MCDFFTSMQLHEYNKNLADYLIFNCFCYSDYEDFTNYIYTRKNSYMACIVVLVDNICKITHKKIPIMLGSKIDFFIRKIDVDDSTLYGSFIIEGCHKQINYFITNNCYNGHVHIDKTKSKKYYKLKLRKGSINMFLSYDLEARNVQDNNSFTYIIRDENFLRNNNYKLKFENTNAMNTAEYEKAKQQSSYSQEVVNIGNEKPNKIHKKYLKNKKIYEKNYDKTIMNMADNIDWITFINMSSPYASKHRKFTETEYENYFQCSIHHGPDLDDLANKTCLSPGTIILRTLEHLIEKMRKDSNANKFNNMASSLERHMKSGNMWFALSQKQDTNFLDDNHTSNISNNTIYMQIEAQKLHLTQELNSKIKRAAINSQTKNSQALMFPNDGLDFLCTIEAKEIKNAGENVSPAQLVFSPRMLEFSKIDEILKEVCYMENLINNNNNIFEHYECLNEQTCSILRVVVNTFLTEYLIPKCKLILLKKRCPILPLTIYNTYININVNGHVLMKYSQQYGFFVTPHEKQFLFGDAFENYHSHLSFGSIAMHVPTTMDLNEPQKSVVTTTTIKGRADMLHNYFQAMAFLNTNGPTNVALVHRPNLEDDELVSVSYCKDCAEPLIIPIHLKNKNPQLRYLKYGEFKNTSNEMPESVKHIFSNFYPNTQDETEIYGICYKDILDNPEDVFDTIQNIITKWYDDSYILTLGTSVKDKITCDKNMELNLNEYAKLTNNKHLSKKSNEDCSSPIYLEKNNTNYPLCATFSKSFNKKYRKKCSKIDIFKKHPPQLILWTAFGDFGGATNEDGVILCEQIKKYGPQRLVSTTLNIKFMEATKIIKKNQTIKKSSSIFYQPINNKTNNILNIGILKSSEALTVTKSKNVSVSEIRIGDEFHYYITQADVNNFTKIIESYYLQPNSTLYFNIRYMCPLDKGTKFLNLHGQKCIVSKVANLVKYCEPAYRRDGSIVKPQILFSTTSLVGRTVASQIYSMACSKDVAFTKDGAMIAPMGYNIHNIEASSKCKQSLVKNDLMTSENGFNSNMLNITSNVLRQQGPIDRFKNPLHYVQQLHTLSGVVIQPLYFDQNLLLNAEENLNE